MTMDVTEQLLRLAQQKETQLRVIKGRARDGSARLFPVPREELDDRSERIASHWHNRTSGILPGTMFTTTDIPDSWDMTRGPIIYGWPNRADIDCKYSHAYGHKCHPTGNRANIMVLSTVMYDYLGNPWFYVLSGGRLGWITASTLVPLTRL